MKRLSLILFSIIICNVAFASSNVVITGVLGSRAMPCNDEVFGCPDVDVITIVNDTATFVLVKNGQMLTSLQELGNNYSFGNDISIYGNVNKHYENTADEFYTLNIISIVQTGIITGKVGMTGTPCLVSAKGCPLADVVAVVNDTAEFVLVKDGRMLGDPQQLGNDHRYYGREVSIYGSYYKVGDEYRWEFYYLNITAVLKELSSDNFSANCTNENLSWTPTISIENDFVIIEYKRLYSVCPEFVLKVSEVINDTLYVFFFDAPTADEICLGECEAHVRLRIPKPETQFSKVYYNGVVYDLNTSDVEQIINQQIQISPNPTNGLIEIKGIENFSNLNYEVRNSIGQMIQSGNLQQTIDLSGKSGIYIFTITENQRVVAREKIMIK